MTEDLDAWRRLGAAMLLQACRDAVGPPWPEGQGPGSPGEAARWLRGPVATGLAAELNLDGALARWLAQPSERKKATVKRAGRPPPGPQRR